MKWKQTMPKYNGPFVRGLHDTQCTKINYNARTSYHVLYRKSSARTNYARILGRPKHKQFGFLPRNMHNHYITGTGSIRSGWTFGRLALGGLVSGVGYVTYKVNELSNWIKEKAGASIGNGIVGMVELLDAIKLPSIRGLLPKRKDKSKKENDSGKVEAAALSGLNVVEMMMEGKEDRGVLDDSGHMAPEKEEGSDFQPFIKKMIEIRHLLNSLKEEGDDGTSASTLLKLPSVVVIGSQSSGKSSVLESIVGHSFLPKGRDLVTRRPLELTLVHVPGLATDYAVFGQGPSLTPGPAHAGDMVRMGDFHAVQKKLEALNAFAHNGAIISNDPIYLAIYGSKVPDLTLIDLPGYIAITNAKQPAELREDIVRLCDTYIKSDNIILAISAADVDLANSEALKAGRRVDPRGERTLGVVTKLDLVPPETGLKLLENKDYPLSLGYVGVICKPVPSNPAQPTAYGPEYSRDVVGVHSLRKRLVSALETMMSDKLGAVHQGVTRELSELEHTFKVYYNDQFITMNAYMMNVVNALNDAFEQVRTGLTRSVVKAKVKEIMSEKLLAVMEQFYWNGSSQENEKDRLPVMTGRHGDNAVFALPVDVNERLNGAAATLTKSHIGRLCTLLMSEDIIAKLAHSLWTKAPCSYHPKAMKEILSAFECSIHQSNQSLVVNQIENALKPFKSHVTNGGLGFTLTGWLEARGDCLELIHARLVKAKSKYQDLVKEVGLKRLKAYESTTSGPSGNAYLAEKASEAAKLSRQIRKLQERADFIENANGPCHMPYSVAESMQQSQCSPWLSWFLPWHYWPFRSASASLYAYPTKHAVESGTMHVSFSPMYEAGRPSEAHVGTIWKDPCMWSCPEVFLTLLMNRLVDVASLYLHYELSQHALHLSHHLSHPAKDHDCKSNMLTTLFQFQSPHSSSMPVDADTLAGFIAENQSFMTQLRLQKRKLILSAIADRLSALKTASDECRTAKGIDRNERGGKSEKLQPLSWY